MRIIYLIILSQNLVDRKYKCIQTWTRRLRSACERFFGVDCNIVLGLWLLPRDSSTSCRLCDCRNLHRHTHTHTHTNTHKQDVHHNTFGFIYKIIISNTFFLKYFKFFQVKTLSENFFVAKFSSNDYIFYNLFANFCIFIVLGAPYISGTSV
jgi:hypothetical protein